MLVRTSLASEGQTPELDRLLVRIRKDLRKNRVDVEAWKELQDQIDRQVALLDERQPANDRKPSFFTRKAREPEPQQQQQQTVPESQPESPEQAEAVPGNARDIEDNAQRLRIARRVGQLLGQVLTQVSLEPAAESRARALQQSLLASNDWDELREGLNPEQTRIRGLSQTTGRAPGGASGAFCCPVLGPVRSAGCLRTFGSRNP